MREELKELKVDAKNGLRMSLASCMAEIDAARTTSINLIIRKGKKVIHGAGGYEAARQGDRAPMSNQGSGVTNRENERSQDGFGSV